MLSIMPRTAGRRPILSQAATALFALASTTPPSAAFVHSAWSPSTSSFARGLSTKQSGNTIGVPATGISASSTIGTSLEAASVVDVEETLMGTMSPSEKLIALRKEMKEKGLDVYLVPSDDPHLSGKCA
jgi:hypothetical protein